MKLPGGDTAVIPPGKLAGYALDPDHRTGGHKARVFRAALGLTAEHADEVEAQLLSAAANLSAQLLRREPLGDEYRIDLVLEFRSRRMWVRSGWRVPTDGSPTRLTTLIPLRRRT